MMRSIFNKINTYSYLIIIMMTKSSKYVYYLYK